MPNAAVQLCVLKYADEYSVRYTQRKLSYLNSKRPSLQWTGLFLSKILYFSIWIIIPMILIDAPWWSVLIGFVVMHYTAGLILSLVFQLAHVMEDAEMPEPDKTGTMKNTWAIHQLLTTVNFSTKNKIVNWFTGGLNHQIEHHIFPHISHVHYTKIAAIVKKTAQEFNLPYNEYKALVTPPVITGVVAVPNAKDLSHCLQPAVPARRRSRTTSRQRRQLAMYPVRPI